MIGAILFVVLPVFLVMAAGYAATRLGRFPPLATDGLMLYTQSFAVPCLLFRAIVDLDLGTAFNPGMLISFYSGALIAFGLGILGARRIFGHRPGESVAIAFAALFSNSVLLGLPIMERAFGPDSLAPNFGIISIHAPFCYLVGITTMEFARADGRSLGETARTVARAMFRNALMIGLLLGFLVNLGHLPYPAPLRAGVEMMANSALPAALFGLGGVLSRYRIRASLGEAGMISALSLVVHPSIAFALAHWVFALPIEFVRGCVVTAAMAPGVNAYVFANLYDRGKEQVASTVLLATALTVLTASAWLALLDALH